MCKAFNCKGRINVSKKDAFYFPHDSNAKDDPKCMHLIESLGLEGYGIYWVLVESLRDQPNYRYPLKMLPAISRKYNSTLDKVTAVVSNYGLFDFDDEDFFYSNSLIERMLPLENKRVQARLAGIASAEKRKQLSTVVQHAFNGRSTDVQPVEESRVEESKKETNTLSDKSATKKTLEERREAFKASIREHKKEEYSSDMLHKFFNHFAEEDTKGKMRFEKEKTWNLSMRLNKWYMNRDNFSRTATRTGDNRENVELLTTAKMYS